VLPHEENLDARIRAYILDNPDVILEALEQLAARQRVAAMAERVAEWPDLLDQHGGLGLGDIDAPIRVVKFFDYRCAPCKAIHPELVRLVANHPTIRIEMRHLPILSPGSERAARFALAVQDLAGDAAYTAVHTALWELEGPLNSASFAPIAARLGLDYETIETVLDSEGITARITYNRDAAISLEILGTPAFVSATSVSFGDADTDALAATWLSQ